MNWFNRQPEAPAPAPAAAPAPPPKSLDDTIFDMKFTARSLNRLSTKATSSIASEKVKLRKALEKGNTDGARIHAENAIRHQSQSLTYLRLASRVEAVASKLEGAAQMATVTASMAQVTSGLGAALDTMDVHSIAGVMDTFERQMEDLDVQAGFVGETMADATSGGVAAGADVDALMAQVAEEHNLKVADRLTEGIVPVGGGAAVSTAAADEEKRAASLEARFAALSAPKS